MKIRNSVALVTGANRGIGRALVHDLIARGARRVYATARCTSGLEALVERHPHRVVPLQLDVTDEASFSRVASQAADVNLLINNAGVLDLGSVLEAPLEAFDRNMAVNFFGVLFAARAFAGTLTRNKGTIVNILTIVALASLPSFGIYNASKAAAWSLTQSLRGDLSKQGVSVIGVFPGAVDTDMLREMSIPKVAPDEIAAAIAEGIEAGHEDIFPDAASRQFYAAWLVDHKSVERQLRAGVES
jgi:NAD(P)-dependent dehydrogenase (short-subunit alcohol dehydrogenase family)